MDLELLGGAAAVALASTLLFVLIAMSWQVVSSAFAARPKFRANTMFEAAQRFRDQVDKLQHRQSFFLATGLVFAVFFTVTMVLRPQDLIGAPPVWQIALLFLVLFVATAYGAYRLVSVMRWRRRLAYVRDACIAVGHGLQRLSAHHNRVFYDVPCGNSVMDNVLVGSRGIYAVYVVARHPVKDNRVRLDGDKLSFAPGNVSMSLSEFVRRSDQFARECRRLLQHEVTVRSVIAVPGWEVDFQSRDRFLVVNERHLSMIGGWKDPKDYLLDEDVTAIQDMLSERCSRY
jgi:hypothetical protein